MKILFILSHELYLRNFSVVLKGLADNGHSVRLAFSQGRNIEEDALRELLALPNITLVDWTECDGWWWPATDILRRTRDFLHSLDTAFAPAEKMRNRIAGRVPVPIRAVTSALARLPYGRLTTAWLLRWLEWCIPCDEAAVSWLNQHDADAVVISPLVDMNYAQLEILKAARHRAVPSIYPVASWDNLTMKGEVQIAPDGVIVWNRFQTDEAVKLHGLDREKIIETGAQLYDQWFDMTAGQSRAAFCTMVGGLDPSKPILLYVASSPYICPDELSFFTQWLARLRRDPDPVLRSCNVLIRPHPLHADQWADLKTVVVGDGRLTIWPRNGEMPLVSGQKQHYFDTLWHADALVGINTSAFLEAGIVGRRTFTFHNDFFKSTQQGTLHFSYVANSGLLKTAPDISGHMDDLKRELSRPLNDSMRYQFPFVAEFLRPNGIDRPATPYVTAAIEKIAATGTNPRRMSLLAPVGRMLLWPLVAFVLRPLYLARMRATRPKYVPRR